MFQRDYDRKVAKHQRIRKSQNLFAIIFFAEEIIMCSFNMGITFVLSAVIIKKVVKCSLLVTPTN